MHLVFQAQLRSAGFLSVITILAASLLSAAELDAPLDIERLRELNRRTQTGEILSQEDQAYYDRGRREMQARKSGKNSAVPTSNIRIADQEMVRKLVPLDELTTTYKGEDGGLYGGGHNAPTGAHLAAYLRESKAIQPLDRDGHPAKSGKIVLLSLGMSNTTMEFSQFVKDANADAAKSRDVVVVDGAIGARTGTAWALDGVDLLPAGEEERLLKIMAGMGRNVKKGFGDTWTTAIKRLEASGVTPRQVQVLWIKQAEAMPSRLGEYPAHTRALEANLIAILNIAKHHYPNLRIAYLSSRIFGGYANMGLNPEPYAYEGALAICHVIQQQIAGEPRLNYATTGGDVKSPLVAWGPYLWANGTLPRKSDGLVWNEDDYAPSDRTHPSPTARQKVSDQLLRFFKTDSGSKAWFLARIGETDG